MEFKDIPGLFAAGQFNGSSGYEEAAAQGLMAGINAVRLLKGQEAVVLDRSDAYIGVLIDDLVTKENREPYRMMTSRAEYRLLLRQDNADLRLTPLGHEIGLISEERFQKFTAYREAVDRETERLQKTRVGDTAEVREFLSGFGVPELKSGASLAELLKRPEFNYGSLAPIDHDRPAMDPRVARQAEIRIKYEGYIERQEREVAAFKSTENKKIPADLDYDEVPSLRIEARQKLKEFRPETVGQASRIAGVSPADVAVLLVWLKRK